jgi:HTH-type transcriptional regulator, competence development regulator
MLASRLASLRKEKKRTQQDMADYLGITRPAYTAYELGNRQPDYEMLQKLADFFETTTDYILGRSDERDIFQYKLTTTDKKDDTYDSLAEITKIVKELGLEQFGFFDIEKWRNLSQEDVNDIRKHFEWVAQKAKERNEEK